MSNKNASINYIKVSKIVPDPEQPRKYFDATKMAALRKSIKRDGILNPLIVEPVEGTDKVSLIDGERRFRAAIEEGLTEVPYIVFKTTDKTDKLLQQFQIQEMHENWTPVEKAQALDRLAEESGQTIEEICQMLALPERAAKNYIGFSKIIDKGAWLRGEVPIDYVQTIQGLKMTVKRVMNNMKKPFERMDEKNVERAVINRIKSGDIRSVKHFTKIKDSIVSDPKFLDKFINTSISPEAMFYESKAQGAYHLRNAITSAGYTRSHLEKFLENPDVKLTERDITVMKYTAKKIKELLDRIGE